WFVACTQVPVTGGGEHYVAAPVAARETQQLHQGVGVVAGRASLVRFGVVQRLQLSKSERVAVHGPVRHPSALAQNEGAPAPAGTYFTEVRVVRQQHQVCCLPPQDKVGQRLPPLGQRGPPSALPRVQLQVEVSHGVPADHHCHVASRTVNPRVRHHAAAERSYKPLQILVV